MHIVKYHGLLMINICLRVNKLELEELIIISDWILSVIQDRGFDWNQVMSLLVGFNGVRVLGWFYWEGFRVF
jgi:hypothetical protein